MPVYNNTLQDSQIRFAKNQRYLLILAEQVLEEGGQLEGDKRKIYLNTGIIINSIALQTDPGVTHPVASHIVSYYQIRILERLIYSLELHDRKIDLSSLISRVRTHHSQLAQVFALSAASCTSFDDVRPDSFVVVSDEHDFKIVYDQFKHAIRLIEQQYYQLSVVIYDNIAGIHKFALMLAADLLMCIFDRAPDYDKYFEPQHYNLMLGQMRNKLFFELFESNTVVHGRLFDITNQLTSDFLERAKVPTILQLIRTFNLDQKITLPPVNRASPREQRPPISARARAKAYAEKVRDRMYERVTRGNRAAVKPTKKPVVPTLALDKIAPCTARPAKASERAPASAPSDFRAKKARHIPQSPRALAVAYDKERRRAMQEEKRRKKCKQQFHRALDSTVPLSVTAATGRVLQGMRPRQK